MATLCSSRSPWTARRAGCATTLLVVAAVIVAIVGTVMLLTGTTTNNDNSNNNKNGAATTSMGSESVDIDVDIVGTMIDDTSVSGNFRPGTTTTTTTTPSTTTTTTGQDETVGQDQQLQQDNSSTDNTNTNTNTGSGISGKYQDLFQQEKKPVVVPAEENNQQQQQQQQDINVDDGGDITIPDREKEQMAIGRTEERTKAPEITYFQGIIEVIDDSAAPSDMPSLVPSDQPSFVPSQAPSSNMFRQTNDLIALLSSEVPSDQPSLVPSDQPSMVPSQAPSVLLRQQEPVEFPPTELILMNSAVPSDQPSLVPSDQPSMVPSQAPSVLLRQVSPTGDDELCLYAMCTSDSDCCSEAPSCRKRDPTSPDSVCSTVNKSSTRVSIYDGAGGAQRSNRGQALLRKRH